MSISPTLCSVEFYSPSLLCFNTVTTVCVLSRRMCVCALMCFCVSCPLCCAVWWPCWLWRGGRWRPSSPPATPHLRLHHPPRCCPQISCSSTVPSWPCSTASTATCSPRGDAHTHTQTHTYTCQTLSQTMLCTLCVCFHWHFSTGWQCRAEHL